MIFCVFSITKLEEDYNADTTFFQRRRSGNGAVSGCPESETATADRGGRVFLLRAICLISGELPFLFLEKQMEV